MEPVLLLQAIYSFSWAISARNEETYWKRSEGELLYFSFVKKQANV